MYPYFDTENVNNTGPVVPEIYLHKNFGDF